MNIGFDQDDLEHMNHPGYFVVIAYTVRDQAWHVIHSTDLVADGPDLASALSNFAEVVE